MKSKLEVRNKFAQVCAEIGQLMVNKLHFQSEIVSIDEKIAKYNEECKKLKTLHDMLPESDGTENVGENK